MGTLADTRHNMWKTTSWVGETWDRMGVTVEMKGSTMNRTGKATDRMGQDSRENGQERQGIRWDRQGTGQQYCDAGSYGINCAESCGHCAGSDPCNKQTGSCSGGCQQWYVSLDTDGPNTCKAHIIRVDYKSSYHVVSLSVTSSSVNVSWPKSDQVTAGLESYYKYVVEATASGQDPKQEITQFEPGQGDQTAVITDLTHNTEYKITVRICARHNSERLNGSAGYPLTVKTKCTAPERPKIKTVTASDPGGSDHGSLQVSWQTLGDNGCDNFQHLLVQYKPEHQGEWKTKSVTSLSQTQKTIDNLPAGIYRVRLSVTNNEGISSVSDPSPPTAVLYQVTAGLESYYRYVVEANASGQVTKQVTRQFETRQGAQSAVIVGMRHNTDYEIRVRISDSTQTLGGLLVAHFMSRLNVNLNCLASAPDKPKIKSATAGSDPGSLQVIWE
ncbi:hypothetical protein LSAT2_005329, partial [Lamellibrachia satsuma]